MRASIFSRKISICYHYFMPLSLSLSLSFFQHPELLVASYNNNEEAPQDPDGVVLVWNAKFNAQTPEYIFHCQVGSLGLWSHSSGPWRDACFMCSCVQ